MENTDAESVDAIVEAKSKDATKPIPAAGSVLPRTNHITTPVRSAVSRTPMVESITP